MRGILLTLIFLNILYFGWKFAEDNQAVDNASTSGSHAKQVPTLVLLSEKTGRKPSGHGVTNAKPIAFCPQIGPFTDKPSALLFATELQMAGIEARLKAKNKVDNLKYWLYLPVQGGQKTALLKLSELREKQVDSYLITKGVLKGSISLGIFSSLESAQGLQNKLQTLGINPKIHSMSERGQQFWLSVALDKLNLKQEQALQAMLEKQSEIKVVQSAC